MKYLISESQLDRIVEKYLDSKDFKIIDSRYGMFFAYSDSDSWAQLRYIPSVDALIINIELADEIESMFGLDRYDSRIVIGDWASKKINVDINDLEIRVYGGSMADANLSM